MKGKALRKHSLHEKTAASVLLKPFISGNENTSENNIEYQCKLIGWPLFIFLANYFKRLRQQS